MKHFTLELMVAVLVLGWSWPAAAQRVSVYGTTVEDGSTDAFGRGRVSQPEALFIQPGFEYDLQSNVWQSITGGNATITNITREASVQLSSGAGGDTNIATRVTYEYFRYQPGKSHLILLTGVLGLQPPGTRSLIGYGDLANGIFFENWGGTNAVVLRSSASGTTNETRVLQSDWGGASADFDPDKANIFAIDFEWLGAGKVRTYLVRDGQWRKLAVFDNANKNTRVYMATPNLPLIYRIANTSTNSIGGTMKQICASVMSEGGSEDRFGQARGYGNWAAGQTVASNRAVFGIRPSYSLSGKTNRARIRITDVSSYVTNGPVRLRLVYRPDTVLNASWTITNGAALIDTNGTTVSGGIVLSSWEVPVGQVVNRTAAQLRNDFRRNPIALDFNGVNPMAIHIEAIPIAGSPLLITDVNWVEEY